MRFGFLIQVGDGQICASSVEGFGTPPGDTMNIGDADNEPLEAFETGGLYALGHDLFLNYV